MASTKTPVVKVGQVWLNPKGKPQLAIKSIHQGRHSGCQISGRPEPHVHYTDGDFDMLFHFGEYYHLPADPIAITESTGAKAAIWLREVANTLEAKSISYGDSIGNPLRIFSKSDKSEGVRVRIDDKLSRIARAKEWPGDDTIIDLVGYLALLAVVERKS